MAPHPRPLSREERGGWLLAALAALAVLAPGVRAQPVASRCEPAEFSLEIEGVGIAQASDLESEGDLATLLGACLEVAGWTLRGESFELDAAAGTLRAADVRLAGPGVAGRAGTLLGSADGVALESLELSGVAEPGGPLAGAGLPPGTSYRIVARAGRFRTGGLELEAAVAERLDAAGRATERLSATAFRLGEGGGDATGVRLAGRSSSATAAAARRVPGGRPQAFGVLASLCRDPSDTGLGFRARSATLLDDGRTLRLEGFALRFFGIELPEIGVVELDPTRPPEVPLLLSMTDGLTAGLDRLSLPGPGGFRLSLALHRALRADRALSFALEGSAGNAAVRVEQPLDASLRALVAAEPDRGFQLRLALDTGRRVTSPAFRSDAYQEGRLGYALAGDLGLLGFRAAAGLGEAWQPTLDTPDAANPSTLEQSRAFLWTELRANAAASFGPFSIDLRSRLTTLAFAGGAPAVAAGVEANATAAVRLPWLAASASLAVSEPLAPSPIRRLETSAFSFGALDVLLAPPIPAPALGFAGIAFDRPRAGLGLEVDLRALDDPARRWRRQALALGIDLTIYDGLVSTDALDRPFQTPLVRLALGARHDFAASLRGFQVGSVGVDASLYACCFVYTLGVHRETRAGHLDGRPDETGWRVNLGVGLR